MMARIVLDTMRMNDATEQQAKNGHWTKVLFVCIAQDEVRGAKQGKNRDVPSVYQRIKHDRPPCDNGERQKEE